MLSLILFSFLFTRQACAYSADAFYERLLNDYSTHSTFVVIDVEAKEYKGKAIIENADLIYFFNQTKGFDEKQYAAYAKDILVNKKRINLNDESLAKWGFRKDEEVSSVKEIAAQGCEQFINHYFDMFEISKDRKIPFIKTDIKDNERDAIISQLFEWHVITQVDDESGYLMIIGYQKTSASNLSVSTNSQP